MRTPPDLELCPGGPLLVRGRGRVVVDDSGTEHRTTHPVSAVCRCGNSAVYPWCDGTHKELAPEDRPGPSAPKA